MGKCGGSTASRRSRWRGLGEEDPRTSRVLKRDPSLAGLPDTDTLYERYSCQRITQNLHRLTHLEASGELDRARLEGGRTRISGEGVEDDHLATLNWCDLRCCNPPLDAVDIGCGRAATRTLRSALSGLEKDLCASPGSLGWTLPRLEKELRASPGALRRPLALFQRLADREQAAVGTLPCEHCQPKVLGGRERSTRTLWHAPVREIRALDAIPRSSMPAATTNGASATRTRLR